MKMSWKIILLFSGLLWWSNSFCQEIDLDAYKKKYPDADAVFLKKKENARVFFEKDQLKVESVTAEQMLVLTENGVNYGERKVSENFFVKVEELKAHSLEPDGKKYKKKEVTEFKKQTDVSDASFYDDGSTTTFIFPGLVPGTKTEMTYREIINEPRFFGATYFSSYIPVEEFEYTVEFPKSVTVNYKLFNTENINIEFTKEEKKKTNIFTWKSRNLPKIKSESAAPSFRYTEPHMVVYISEFSINGKDSVLLKTPAELYKWYAHLVKNVSRSPDPDLKKLVDSLVKGEPDEFEKVKKIFYWVQDKISYIAFEDGLGGFIPREAEFVCEKKFGDCKDMANLIYTMLNAADIRSYRTWIGSRAIPYKYTEVPTPMVDNHMITTYIDKNGKAWFLDATGKNAPVTLFTSFIQGKEAMLGINDKEFKILTVPEVEKEKNKTYDSIDLRIENGQLSGWGKLDLEGYPKNNLVYGMSLINQEKQRKFVKQLLEKGNNKFSVDSVHFNDKGKEAALEIAYRCKIPDYLLVNKDEIYVNLNLDKRLKNYLQNDQKRVAPMEFEFKEVNRIIVRLQIPEGYKVTFLPEAVDAKNDIVGYSARYSVEGNVARLEYNYYINTLLLDKSKFSEWNQVIRKMIEAGNESIILKKK
jgi:transglutaminase-like putative cysteine protease